MRNAKSQYNKQGGAVLMIGLIMLLLLTVIGMASIRGSELQERMAGNTRDRNLAFQASETGLRAGEKFLTQSTLPAFNGAGLWPDLNKVGAAVGAPGSWSATDWTANSIKLPADTLKGLSDQPSYTIEQIIVTAAAANPGSGLDIESQEKMGGTSEYFRVTSRGFGGTKDSEVVLQSTYNR